MGTTIGVAGQTFSGYYGYRTSKAVAHIAFATPSKDLAPEGIIAAVVCPGWVRTDMGVGATLEPRASVALMILVMDDLTLDKNGMFLDCYGTQLSY